MMPERKRPPTPGTTHALPAGTIAAMRAMYRGGDSANYIATHLGCDRWTVQRHCRDITQPKREPLTHADRNNHLIGWRRFPCKP